MTLVDDTIMSHRSLGRGVNQEVLSFEPDPALVSVDEMQDGLHVSLVRQVLDDIHVGWSVGTHVTSDVAENCRRREISFNGSPS